MSILQSKEKDVLIVDDDENLRQLVRKILENVGYTVNEADSVKMALELAEKKIPHVILTDLHMPVESGFVLLEKKRAIEQLSPVPVLVLSRISEKKAVYHAMSLGAFDYIVKPVRAALLIQKLRKVLRESGFPVYKSPQKEEPTVELSTFGRVIQANEVGFQFESPFRLHAEAQVHIKAKILDELGLADCIFRSTAAGGKQSPTGLYVNEVNTVGIGKSTAEKVRKIISTW